MSLRRILGTVPLVLAAAASPVAAADGAFGAGVSPSPLIVENYAEPAFTVTNRGSVPIFVVIELDANSGYAMEANSLELAPGAAERVALTQVGETDVRVRFHITNGLGDFDRQAMVLDTVVRHRTIWETVPWNLVAFGAVLVALLVIVGTRRLVLARARPDRAVSRS